MNPIWTDPSPTALAAAFESNLFAMFELFNRWPQAEVHDTPELLWTLTNIPFPLFNSVLRARLPSGSAQAVIDSVLAEFRSRELPLMWWVGPSSQPASLGKILEERGFHRNVNPGMAADLTSLPADYPLPEGLSIKRVEDEAELDQYCRVLVSVFGMKDFVRAAFFDFFMALGFDSPFINYIGLAEKEVVATSSVFLGGGVAGIYNVATLPASRRKGIGAAMTALPLLEAGAAGCRIAALESSEAGLHVYQRLGFRETCEIAHYIWMPDG